MLNINPKDLHDIKSKLELKYNIKFIVSKKIKVFGEYVFDSREQKHLIRLSPDHKYFDIVHELMHAKLYEEGFPQLRVPIGFKKYLNILSFVNSLIEDIYVAYKLDYYGLSDVIENSIKRVIDFPIIMYEIAGRKKPYLLAELWLHKYISSTYFPAHEKELNSMIMELKKIYPFTLKYDRLYNVWRNLPEKFDENLILKIRAMILYILFPEHKIDELYSLLKELQEK